MDYQKTGSELLRALRGRRSQRAFSVRLGYASNAFYRWESGVCSPTALTAFQIATNTGVPLQEALFEFLGLPRADRWQEPDFGSREGVALLVRHLRRNIPLTELSREVGVNRFALSRWCRGLSEPSLPELLRLVQVTTRRLLDFIAVLCSPSKLPSLAPLWKVHVASRDAAYDAPWSHAVLRALELQEYQALAQHEEGWLARRLGIPLAEEQRCLRLLLESNQIHWEAKRYTLVQQSVVDTGQNAARAKQLRRFWLEQALMAFDSGARGAYGYNLFAISNQDYEALRKLYANFFEGMRQLISNSTSGDKLVLFCGQLVELEERKSGLP